KNLTTKAKSLFINKFLSASPPMDVHSTAFLTQCNTLIYFLLSSERFLNAPVTFNTFSLPLRAIFKQLSKVEYVSCFTFFGIFD
ncbi:hypothetical protein, partial [Acinetobacter haemolyticus]|uniref:hypothetical protein n=1 Tax=Acinetobacter haemolyticus TaxID=29430 RepID=UPI003009A58C